MTKKDFFINLKILLNAYNKEFNKEQIIVWYDFFKNEKTEIFSKAIKRIILNNNYFPSIAEIKKEIAYLTNDNLQLDVYEEWQEVLNAVRRFDIYDGERAISTLKKYTQKIVKQVGWYRICTSENIVWEKKEFIKLFNDGLNKTTEIEVKKNNLTYKEQIILEEQEIDKQNLLELEN